MMGLWIADALAITAGTEFMYGVSRSAYLNRKKQIQEMKGQKDEMKRSSVEKHEQKAARYFIISFNYWKNALQILKHTPKTMTRCIVM